MKALGEIRPLSGTFGDGPARYFIIKLPQGEVNVGLISALSHKFCSSCNRVRLTADGNLIPCIASSVKYDLRSIPRSKNPDKIEKLKTVLEKAIYNKPLEHQMEKIRPTNELRKLGG